AAPRKTREEGQGLADPADPRGPERRPHGQEQRRTGDDGEKGEDEATYRGESGRLADGHEQAERAENEAEEQRRRRAEKRKQRDDGEQEDPTGVARPVGRGRQPLVQHAPDHERR